MSQANRGFVLLDKTGCPMTDTDGSVMVFRTREETDVVTRFWPEYRPRKLVLRNNTWLTRLRKGRR